MRKHCMYVTKEDIKTLFPTEEALSNNWCQKKFDANSNKAFSKIERLVSLRDRSVLETKRRLMQAGFTQESVDIAIKRALRCGYLDDTRFAQTYLRSKIQAGKGLDGILKALKDKFGINTDSIEGFPQDYLPQDYDSVQAAIALLERKPPRAKNKKHAAFSKLIRDGYTTAIAYAAVAEWEQLQTRHIE